MTITTRDLRTIVDGETIIVNEGLLPTISAVVSSTAEELATTGDPVVISGSAPPTTGQALVATSATTAEWQDVSGSGGLTNDPTIQTSSFSAALNTVHYVSNYSGGDKTVTLPSSPTDGDRVEIISVGSGGNKVTIDGGGHAIVYPLGALGAGLPYTFNLQGFHLLVEFRDSGAGGLDRWQVIGDEIATRFGDSGQSLANAVLVSSDTGIPFTVQMDTDSVLVRGSGNIYSQPIAGLIEVPVTRRYLDVYAATAEALPAYTVTGEGLTTYTADTSGALFVDGVSMVGLEGELVAVLFEDEDRCGVFTVTDAGNETDPWILTVKYRYGDSALVNQSNDIFRARYGDVNAGKEYIALGPTTQLDVISSTSGLSLTPAGTAGHLVSIVDDATVHDSGIASSSVVLNTRTVTAGTGLTGGGDLSANRTFAVSYGTTSGTALQGNQAAGGDSTGTLNNLTNTQARGLKSATTTVSVSGATAPSSGQVLTATSSTAATWQTPASGVSLTSSAPGNVTKASAAVGTATDAARSDHKHDVTTATASSLSVGGSNAEGTASSLARSDHTHALPAFGTSSGTFMQGNQAAGGDSSGTLDALVNTQARGLKSSTTTVSVSSATAPSSGQVLTATSSTAATWQTPASGVSLTSNAPTQITVTTAAVGSGTAAAKDDHVHSVSTAAPSTLTVGGSNSAGSATSLSRSDHTHALPAFGTSSGTFMQGNQAAGGDSSGTLDALVNTQARGLKSATTTVSVSSATAPSSGQVLTATSSTAATWQTPTSGGDLSSSISSSTDGRVAVFDSTTGKLVKQGSRLEADLAAGPASSTSGNLPSFNGTGGKTLQDSGIAAANVALVQTVSSISSNTTAAVDHIYLVDSTSGTITMTLPAAASSTNKTITVKQFAGSNPVIIDGNASETIDGATTLTMSIANEWAVLACNGSAWAQVG